MATGQVFSQKSGGMRNDPAERKALRRGKGLQMKKLMLLAFVAVLSACNTVAGIGEDISGGARATQERF